MKQILLRLAREPAALGGAVTAWVAVANPSPAVMAATTATVAWVVRAFSVSKQRVAEVHEQGRNEALADVASLTGS